MPQVMFAMNSEKSETTNDSAYNLVFGMAPHSHPGCSSRIGDESDSDSDGTGDECLPTSSPFPESSTTSTTPPSRPIPVPRPRTTVAAAASDDAACSDGIRIGNEESSEAAPSRPVPVPRPRTTLGAAASEDTTRSDEDDTASAWSEQRTEARNRAYAATLKSAERMSMAYNSSKKRRVQTFDVGDNVSVAIPALDRTCTDVRRLPGQVTAVKGNKVQMYEVATEYGLLQIKLRAGDLQSYNGDVDINTTRYNI